MTEYKPLEVNEFPRTGAEVTEENLYWKRLEYLCSFKEFGAVDFIDFCHQEPFNVAATCSAQVQIYSTTNNALHCSLSRFKKTAYGGVFRKDGKLLAAGSDDGRLYLFQLQPHKLRKIYEGHTAATHRCNFTMDGIHLVSFSDDKSVALWDLPTGNKIKSFEEHKDYIRAGVTSQDSHDIFLSGSYDHTVKMWDSRTGSCAMSADHGVPVEAVAMFPSGRLFISAGGTSIKVWDRVAGRLLTEVSQHHKTITCLCFARDGRHLMSGSLDRHIKIYDVTSYEVVHTLTYASPIVSASVAPGDKFVAVGMTTGLLYLSHQKQPRASEKEKRKNITLFSNLHGANFKLSEDNVIVPEEKKNVLKKYDKCLRKFEYSRALDTVLKNTVQSMHPEITVSVMQELMRRGSIRAAMGGRRGESLSQLVKFVTKNIAEPRFTRDLTDVAGILIELYGPRLNDPETKKCFEVLLCELKDLRDYTKKSFEVQGIIEAVMA